MRWPRRAPERRPRLAIDAFGYWHLLLLLGIVAMAAAEKSVVAHPGDGLELRTALALGGGAAVYLLGDVLFRRSLDIGRGHAGAPRAAVLALATIPLALAAAVLQLAALVAAAGAPARRRGRPLRPRRPAPSHDRRRGARQALRAHDGRSTG